jgi:multiple sugar transport system substrate-binding protein
MKSSIKAIAAATVLFAGAGLLTGCSGSANGGAAANGKTTIVVSIDAGLKKPAVDAFNAQVTQFEKANPNITVTSREYTWTGTTFAAELAGGTLPDVFTIPFTDGRSLIEQKQVADISSLVKALPYSSKFNPAVVKNGEDSSGNIQAIPIAAYGQALHYNRSLFTKAGLNPDKPPTTWQEIRQDAKAISDKTGEAGYATMTQANTGGWIFTSAAYAMGGRAETKKGNKFTATVDTNPFKKALTDLKTMRWTDNSMGGNFLYDWNGINQAFAAGKIGMYISGGGNYGSLVAQNAINPADYGETVVPLEGKDAGALGGGTLAVVSAKADDAAKKASVKWIDYFYMSKLITKSGAVRDAKTQADSQQPVGAPQVPVFDRKTYQLTQDWIKQYVNVPVAQMKPYISQAFDQPIIPEPASQTQALYGALDPVVQAVLTDKNANVDQLLSQANTSIQQILNK